LVRCLWAAQLGGHYFFSGVLAMNSDKPELPWYRGNRLDTEERIRAAEADARAEKYWHTDEDEAEARAADAEFCREREAQ
jgi:hypothetical protein